VVGLRSWEIEPGMVKAKDPEDAVEKALSG